MKGNATGSESNGRACGSIAFSRSIAILRPVGDAHLGARRSEPGATGGAHIQTETSADGRAVVKTFDPSGNPTFYGFNLIVAC